MTTMQQKLESLMYNYGLWEDETHTIVENLKKEPDGVPMNGRWNDDWTTYPEALMVGLLMSAKRVAIKWLEETRPQHIALTLMKAA